MDIIYQDNDVELVNLKKRFKIFRVDMMHFFSGLYQTPWSN